MLSAQNITIHYDSREVVADISLTVTPGEVVAIIGPNGAGKSTLLRALNGSVVPFGGTVLLDERPLKTYARRVMARKIAVVAQEAELRFPVTVLEFVLGGRYAWASAWGWETDQDLDIARRILTETELENFGDRLMNELSGGERQRAVLARALATQAKILLLDEPTANLDLAHQAMMLRLVRNYCDTAGHAAVVVTHDVNLAAEFANRVMLVKGGRMIAMGVPSEVLTAELLRSVFDMKVLVDVHPISGAPRVTPMYVS